MHHMIVNHHLDPRQSPIAKLVSNTKPSFAQRLDRSGASSIEKSGAKLADGWARQDGDWWMWAEWCRYYDVCTFAISGSV